MLSKLISIPMKQLFTSFRLCFLVILGLLAYNNSIAQTINTVTILAGDKCAGSTISVSVTLNTTPGSPIPITISLGTSPLVGNGCGIFNESDFTTTISAATATFSYTLPTSFTFGSANRKMRAAISGSSRCSAAFNILTNPALLPSFNGAVGISGPGCKGVAGNLTTGLITPSSASYSWQASGPGVFSASNVSNPTYTPSAGGSYSFTVRATSTSSCSATASSSFTVTVNGESVITPTTPICVGQSITLSATGGGVNNYSWAGAGANGSFSSTVSNPTFPVFGTPANPIFTALESGTVTIYVSASPLAGCPATASVAITIHPLPTPSASVVSPSLICKGSTVQLTVTGGTSQAWNKSGGLPQGFNSTLSNPSFLVQSVTSPAFNGTFSVTVTNSNSCSNSTTVSLSVTPPPPISASSNSPVCENSPLNLSVDTSPLTGGSFSWAGPSSFSTTVKNPSINKTPLANDGLYTVTFTNSGICAATATTSVKVVPLIAANFTTSSGKNYLCPGKTLLLTAPFREDATYEWFLNTFALIPPGNTNTLTITLAGPYTIKMTGTGACKNTDSKQIYITAATPLSVSATNTVTSSKITLNANPAGQQYAWSGPASFSSALKSPVIMPPTPANGGIYTVNFLTPSTGCTATATTFVNLGSSRFATADESGIDAFELSTYPNPTAGQLSVVIQLPEPSSVKLKLSNALGNNQSEWQLGEESLRHETSVDLSRYQPGLYLLQAESNNKRVVKKIVKIQ